MSLGEVFSDSLPSVKNTYRLPPELALTYDDIYYFDENTLIGTVSGDIQSGRFFFIDLATNNLSWIPNFPQQNLEVPKQKTGYLYSSATTFHNELGIIASGMKLFDRIDFVNMSSKEVFTSVQQDNAELKEVDLNSDSRLFPLETKFFYQRAFGTDKYAYFLYSGSTELESTQDRMKPLQLHVFDWAGRPIYKAQLDNNALGSFFVDERKWTLYAINHGREIESEILVSYDLSNLKGEKF